MAKVAVPADIRAVMAWIRSIETANIVLQELKVAEIFMKNLREKVARQNGKKNAAGMNVVNAQRAVEQIQHQQRGQALLLHIP